MQLDKDHVVINGQLFRLNIYGVIDSEYLEFSIIHDPKDSLEPYRQMKFDEDGYPFLNHIVYGENRWSRAVLENANINFNTSLVTLRFKIHEHHQKNWFRNNTVSLRRKTPSN